MFVFLYCGIPQLTRGPIIQTFKKNSVRRWEHCWVCSGRCKLLALRRRDDTLDRDVGRDNVQGILRQNDEDLLLLDAHDGRDGGRVLGLGLGQALAVARHADAALLLQTIIEIIEIDRTVLLNGNLGGLGHDGGRRNLHFVDYHHDFCVCFNA